MVLWLAVCSTNAALFRQTVRAGSFPWIPRHALDGGER
jgi:hypothetical protein